MSPGRNGASSFAGGCSMCPWTPPVLQCTTRRRAGASRAFEHVARPFDVDRVVGAVGLTGFTIGRGNVIGDLHAVERRGHRILAR